MLAAGLSSVLGAGIVGVALGAVVLAIAGYWFGLALLAAEYGGLVAFHVTQTGDWSSSLITSGLLWTVILVGVGFGLEPLAERLGSSMYRLSHQTLMYASVAMLVVMFVAGLTWMLPAAFAGAVAGGLMSGTPLSRALSDGVGALLAIFGAKGVRLLCACALASLVVSMGPMALAVFP